jgi:hypothetical protein
MNLFGEHSEIWRRTIFVLHCKISQEWQIRLGLLVLVLWLCIDWIYIWLISIYQSKLLLLFYLSVDGEDSILLKRLFLVIFWYNNEETNPKDTVTVVKRKKERRGVCLVVHFTAEDPPCLLWVFLYFYDYELWSAHFIFPTLYILCVSFRVYTYILWNNKKGIPFQFHSFLFDWPSIF